MAAIPPPPPKWSRPSLAGGRGLERVGRERPFPQGMGGERDRRALTWEEEEAAAGETGLERALATAARRRKGRGGASATPSSRHPSTTRAAIGPGRQGAGSPMGSRGLCRHFLLTGSGPCAEWACPARRGRGWWGDPPQQLIFCLRFVFFPPPDCGTRADRATPAALPCPARVCAAVASREAQAPPLRRSSPLEGAGRLPSCSREVGS